MKKFSYIMVVLLVLAVVIVGVWKISSNQKKEQVAMPPSMPNVSVAHQEPETHATTAPPVQGSNVYSQNGPNGLSSAE